MLWESLKVGARTWKVHTDTFFIIKKERKKGPIAPCVLVIVYSLPSTQRRLSEAVIRNLGILVMQSTAAPAAAVSIDCDNEDPARVKRRLALFLVVCVGVRLGLAMLLRAHTAGTDGSRDRAAATLCSRRAVALGFTLVALNNLRMWLSTAPQNGAISGCPIWWDYMRPLHVAVCVLVAVSLATNALPTDYAWRLMALDIAVGTLAVLRKYR